MELLIYDNKYKSTIVFIHGLGKKYDDWNISEHGKKIGIESNIRKTKNTVLVSLHGHYNRSIEEVCKEIHLLLDTLLKTKITCVCHSFGAIYGTYLTIKQPDIFKRLILIDPSLKTNEWIEKFKTINSDKANLYGITDFDSFPNYLDIPKSIIVRAHICLESELYSKYFIK